MELTLECGVCGNKISNRDIKEFNQIMFAFGRLSQTNNPYRDSIGYKEVSELLGWDISHTRAIMEKMVREDLLNYSAMSRAYFIPRV